MSSASEKFEEKELHILKCAIQFFFRHIRFDDSTVARMAGNEIFQQFDEYDLSQYISLSHFAIGGNTTNRSETGWIRY